MNVFVEGMVLGFSLAFLFGFGPAFFALIQTGIHRGFFQGALLAFGILLNDAFVIVLSILGVAQIFSGDENYRLLGILGGSILIVIGLLTFRKKVDSGLDEQHELNSTVNPLGLIIKGFVMNIANPFVWLFWIGISVGIVTRFGSDTTDIVLFFAGTLSIVFITDLSKTFAASRLKKFVTHKFLILVNKIAGLALSGFGVYLIVRAVLKF